MDNPLYSRYVDERNEKNVGYLKVGDGLFSIPIFQNGKDQKGLFSIMSYPPSNPLNMKTHSPLSLIYIEYSSLSIPFQS